MPACKTCECTRKKSAKAILQRRERYKKNKSKIIAYNKAFYLKNLEQYQISNRRYYQNNKIQALVYGWKQKGILNSEGKYFTYEDYTRVLQLQGGVCAICKSDGKDHKKGLVVDHNHKTGIYRGILCALCNTALSFFKEDKIIMQQAIKYLTL